MRYVSLLLLTLVVISYSGVLIGCGQSAIPKPKGSEEELKAGLKADTAAAEDSESGEMEFNEPLPVEGNATEEVDDG